MNDVVLDPAAARARAIAREDMVACRLAFIDCKLPGSDLKENYSMIGPGVTQSDEQVVNLREPHGFNIGAAAMPAGVTNNLHLHFSAEVFFVHSGHWKFRWGSGEGAGELEGGPGDVLSIPTWIFRGFSNIGQEHGWIFTALGGDDTGGIIWHPDVLTAAAGHDLYLGRDNTLLQGAPGQPPAAELIRPLTGAQLAALPRYTPAQMRRRAVTAQDRDWSANALLGARACELAPVIGHGMSEDRTQAAPIANPHGFSVDWLRLAPAGTTGRLRLRQKQVLIVMQGEAELVLNGPGQEVVVPLREQAVYSVPAGVWRELRHAGGQPATVISVCAGDERKRIEWPAETRDAAAVQDVALDPDGYLARRSLLPDTAVGVGDTRF